MTSRSAKESFFQSGTRKIRAYFHSQEWKDTLIFSFFVLLALGFWFMNSLQQEYEIEVRIPIKYKNTPPALILSADTPHELVVKLKDKGTVLMNYIWLAAFSPIEVNMAEFSKGAATAVARQRKNIEADISKQLKASTSLVSFEPQQLEVRFAVLSNRLVPVNLNLSLQLQSGFQLSDSVQLSPASVEVFAEKSVLDSLTFVQTEPLTIRDAATTQEFVLALTPIGQARLGTNQVKVTIPIEEFTEKRFKLPVICEDQPPNSLVRTLPTYIEVVCNVPMSRFKEINVSDFEIRIPFADFEANIASGQLPIYLSRQPLDVSHVVLQPNRIEFIIEQDQP